MRDTVMAVLIALIPSAAFGAIIQAVITNIRNKREEKDLTKVCFRMLYLDLLERMGDNLCRQGYVTKTQFKVFEECYHIYHDPDKLDGNGYAKKVFERVDKLEIRDDD